MTSLPWGSNLPQSFPPKKNLCPLSAPGEPQEKCGVCVVNRCNLGLEPYRGNFLQFSSVAQSCPTLCDPMDCSTPGLPVHHQLPELPQSHAYRVMMPSNHLILCWPLLLPPSIFPSIRIFSSDSVLHIRWSKYWSFSFSISPSNKYSGQISFRMDWLDLLAVQRTLQSLLQHHSLQASVQKKKKKKDT